LPKTRVFALAKELNLETKVLMALLAEQGIQGLTPASQIDDDAAAKARAGVRQHAEAAAGRTDAERAVSAQVRMAPGALALAQAKSRAAARAAEAAPPADFLEELAPPAQTVEPEAVTVEEPTAPAVTEEARPARPERPRPERPERPAAGARPERGERPTVGARPERGERPTAGARPERGERPTSGARPERGERPTSGARTDRSGARTDRGGARPDRGTRPDRGERPRRRGKDDEEGAAEDTGAPTVHASDREASRAREAEKKRELEAELAVDEDQELRRLEEELHRLERDEKRGAGLIALEELTPEEREEERRRGREALVKPIPERAKRPTGERSPTAIDVPPVVCVLGHVDHGKTTLLDAFRETRVTDSEFGGITQHIGASEVEHNGRRIVFLDTPGHAAFTAMRARGALITDIAILVVAADDGVMPQTIEAINHVRSAGVPIIVAMNKMDVPGANVDRLKQQLAVQNLQPEDWGGSTVVVPVSALKREGLSDVLDMIFLVAEAELGDLWGDPAAPFAGVVVEAELDASRGPVATVLVRNGSLKVGDILVCGSAFGRVRRINDWRGKMIKDEVGPGRAVQLIGLSGVPESGEIVEKASSQKVAREIAAERSQAIREDRLASTDRASLSELFRQFQEGAPKELNIVLKADVWGSLQAMRQALYELNEELEEVEVNIIHDAVGDVSESDVLLAVASEAIVLGFHVDADTQARAMADNEGVDIRTFNVIYEAIDEIRAAMHGMLDPIFEDRMLGRAEVLQIFRISRVGVIAGCLVTEGRVERGAEMRVSRDGEVIYEGRIDSLKHVAEDVRSIDVGSECGIATPDFRGWKAGDTIECHKQVEIPRRLPAARDARPSSVGAGSMS
jgi:translation initiation factor IF-2